jgi:23S rRNA-/tRNA-specific pseudouridylate synthase
VQHAILSPLDAHRFGMLQVRRLYYSITAGVPKEAQGAVETNIWRHPTDRKRMAAFGFGSSKGKESISTYRCGLCTVLDVL